ncbi:AAA family ATPase [Actinomycetes bacterium KLBMP 9797]
MTPLVGRVTQVRQLDAALAAVAGGRFAVVEISGEPGIGKTRMLHELRLRAAAAGLPVYAGRATEFERSVPFGMYTEALAPLLPAAAGAPRIGGAEVRRLLEGAGRPGLVLILDDVHWADEASVELTEYLIRKPLRIPMVVAVAFRGGRAPGRLVAAVAQHGPAAIRMILPALGAADLAPLLPEAPARRRALVLRASRGNPLYVQAVSRLSDEALAALLDDQDPDADAGGHILAGLAAEIRGLDPGAQTVAHAAAVVGDHATIDLVAAVAQLPADAVAGALDRLYALGYVDVDGVRCRFRHPLVRAAARSLGGPTSRVAAHARAATHLHTHHGPLPLRAHHTERSAQPGDERAAQTLVEAGRAFAYPAPVQAARWLAAALRILPGTGPLHAQRPAITLLYARTLGLSGHLDRCRAVLADLRAGLAGPVDAELSAQAEAFSAMLARLRGDIEEAAAVLTAQLRRGHPRPVALGRLRLELAALDALRENGAGAMHHAERALALLGADGADRAPLAAAAQSLRAFGALYSGQTGAARRHIADAARLVDAVDDVALRPHLELVGPLSWVETQVGRLPEAGRHLARAREVVDSVGQSAALAYLLVVQSTLNTRMGRLPQAVALAREAAAEAERVGSVEMRAMADAVLIGPLLWTAGPVAAIAVARDLAAADRPRARMWRRVGHLHLALALLADGAEQACLDLLAGSPAPWPDALAIAVPRHVLRAVALARAGALPAARAAADEASGLAAEAGLAYETGLAGYARAAVATAGRRLDEAATLAGQAAARLTTAGAPLEAALAHHLAGTAHSRAGRARHGREALHRAETGYRECGATWLLSRMAGEAREAREEPTLTAREREIAELVRLGLTNQEIAARLVLSRRTVESHLRRVFAKLEVRSRTAMLHRITDLATQDQGVLQVVRAT